MGSSASKDYNKAVMRSGKKSNQYINESLELMHKYTTNYGERLDYWTGKLNNQQLDLLQDKYLAENAAMLRGSAAFGSNSETNRQITQNAYDQQNYLANVQNQNVQQANALQTAELEALDKETRVNYENRAAGAQAAAAYDQQNNAWIGTAGAAAQAVGSVLMFTPLAPVGAALTAVGTAAQAYYDGSVSSASLASAAQAGQVLSPYISKAGKALSTAGKNIKARFNQWKNSRNMVDTTSVISAFG